MIGPRRVTVQVVKTEPLSRDEWNDAAHWYAEDMIDLHYGRYLDRHQPFHWRAKAGNNEPIAHGENYFHATDALDTIRLLCDPATTVTLEHDGQTTVLREGYAELLAEVERRRNEINQAHALIDRIGVTVGWGDNPAPEDSEDALSSVLIALNRWVSPNPHGGAR